MYRQAAWAWKVEQSRGSRQNGLDRWHHSRCWLHDAQDICCLLNSCTIAFLEMNRRDFDAHAFASTGRSRNGLPGAHLVTALL